MISLDTNFLVRAYLGDDDNQTQIARDFFARAEQEIFISYIVLAEFTWILKMKKFTRQETHKALSDLLNSGLLIFENSSVVEHALELYQKGSADFPDCLILAEGLSHGIREFKTFDKKFNKEIQTIING